MMQSLSPTSGCGLRSRLFAAASLALLLFFGAQTAALAQATISGRVVDAEIGEPLSGVLIEVATGTGGVVATATSGADGGFRIAQVPPGRYSLILSTLGYETQRLDGVGVETGTTAVGTIELVSRAFRLNPVVVTASREQEKALDAPAAVYTVNTEAIEERTASTAVEHVKGTPGVDVVSYGIAQHNVVARGFNNVFSGALFVLTDNRWASIPSLRFNAHNMIPATNEDIDRIEMVLGPGSALYGPNVDVGVMHMITRSPLDDQGTTVSLAGGERKVFQGTLRHAGLFSDNVGYKISGMYFRGDDWEFDDPLEILPRDFDQERVFGDARFDFRVDDETVVTVNGGVNRMISSIEMTGIGGAQAKDWTYGYAQARLRRGQLFAQSYINFSDAGETVTLRDGQLITDNSLLYVGQVQHGANLGERQRFIYGADLIRTIPRTEGIINGRNEDSDDIFEIGGYVQSESELSPMVDLVLAGRLDYHDIVDDVVFSPRAAIVVKPTDEHSFRATYNRAFSQPTTNNLFLDKLSSPDLQGLPFPVRGRGAPEGGFTFSRDCESPLSALTEPTLCMRSPFTPAALGGPITQLPLDATLFWDAAVQVVAAQDAQAGALLGLLTPPNATQVSSVMRSLNPTTAAFDLVEDVSDVGRTKSQINNTLEFGYKGLIADRVLLGADIYYTKIEDFIGPLLVETPNVFMDPTSLGGHIAAELTRLAGLGQFDPALIPATTAALTEAMASVPLATVTPDQVASDGSDAADIILTYRNFPSFELWGFDLGMTVLLSDYFTITGMYSFVSDNLFTNVGDSGLDVPLNAPKNKAAGGFGYRNERIGVAGDVKVRWVEEFPVRSGVYIGDVDDYFTADVNVTYALPFSRATEVTLTVTNLFDEKHIEMVGAPQLGRLLLVRLRQSI